MSNREQKYKKGELEAKQILGKKGIKLNPYDDGSRNSMPDLQYEDGRFLEVTHTLHNIGAWSSPTKFLKKPLDERMTISKKVEVAWNRIQQDNYEKDKNEDYTDKGKLERDADRKTILNYRGYDIDNPRSISEFHADCPAMRISAKNILREIIEDKGKKYPGGNVDLFIFITEDEYNSFWGMRNSSNGNYEQFCLKIKNSPFKTIYLCVWDMNNQKYEIDNPTIIKIVLTGTETDIQQI